MSVTTIAPTHASRLEIDAILDALGAELDVVARTLTDAIHEHLPELDDDLHALTQQSVRSNLGVIVTMLREGTAPERAVAPPEAVGYTREYVRRGLGLELLQRAYRTAQAGLSRMLLERLRAAPDNSEHLVEALGFFNDWLFAWVEAVERQLPVVYLGEREQWVRGAAAMRAAEVRALLEGARPGLAETSGRLAYDLNRRHVAFVVWSDEADGDAGDGPALFGEMERVSAHVAARLGTTAVLTVPQGRHLACWAGVHKPPTAPDRALVASELRIAYGAPHQGVDGFCLSHREALEARRVARFGAAPCTRFGDVALDALATHDVDAARRFVTTELGALAAGDDPVRRLRATVGIFLDEGSSFVRTARRLGVHENTVAYRVHRAEALLGRRTTERQLELRVALRLARVVGC